MVRSTAPERLANIASKGIAPGMQMRRAVDHTSLLVTILKITDTGMVRIRYDTGCSFCQTGDEKLIEPFTIYRSL